MENNKINTSRASQTRVKDEQPKVWTPPSSLDAPPAPDGYRHRWIRAESMGFDDTKNMTGKIRSGWELVRADEYPELNIQHKKTGSMQESSELAAYCWLGYQKKSLSRVKLIIKSRHRIETTQLITI